LTKNSFSFSAIVAIGAVVQSVLFAVLPQRYAFVPIGIIVLNAVVTTIIQVSTPNSNFFISDVVRSKVSAQLPDRETGSHGSEPARKSLVVLHLGARINHPLGVLAPGGRQLGDYFAGLNKELDRRADEFGLLHISLWQGTERHSNNTLMGIYYFHDIEGLNRFAHDKLHREAWDWIKRPEFKHFGIFHEAFCAAPGAYETVYLNSNQVLMGAADTKCIDENSGEEVWVNSLVNADVSALRGQHARMGRQVEKTR
jgi:fumagillin biosynthesis monooxygenase